MAVPATTANSYPSVLRDTMLGLVRRDGTDLTARQLSVLLICCLETGHHTVRGLAERLKVAKPAISRAADRLEQFDLVARRADPRDRRSVLIDPTANGSAYVANLRRLLQVSAKAHGVGQSTASANAVAA